MSPIITQHMRRFQTHWQPTSIHLGTVRYYGHSIARRPGQGMRVVRANKRQGRECYLNFMV